MARSQSYQYFDLAKPTLPYISYTSPVDESPHLIQGSQNVLVSNIGYAEKRPGFSTRVGSASPMVGTIKRIFPWRRWGSSFFVMTCSISGGIARVYKFEQGVDSSFILIWTSSTAVPFDFVVSDNFCFFGNGTDMRKYDGTQVTKWGCDAPSTAPDVSLLAGSLPPGLTGVGNNLAGTPTNLGTSQVTVTVTDSVGGTTSKTFNITVLPNSLRINNPSVLPEIATSGGPFSIGFTATAGTAPYTWTVFSGAIPAGMTLNATTGILSGTPTTPGPYGFAIKVTDAVAATAVQAFSLYVMQPGTLSVAPPSPLMTGIVGTPYTETITASGGTAPYTFSYLSASGGTPEEPFNTLPTGITFTGASPDVNLGGTPTTAGVWAFRLLVQDSAGNSYIFPYTISVITSTLTIVNQQLPPAYQGVAYSTFISVLGGTPPYTYVWVGGTLDGQTGYIYGYSYTTIYGHESNVSPLSETTGIFTGRDPAVLLIASGDPQVNGINLYRTTDGGVPDPAIMRLVISLPNTNQTYLDSTLDQFLGTQTGPGFLINTPPTPTIGFVWSNGRIYGFIDNKTYYSGAEEVSNGIQEEAWPSGLDGNVYAWPAQVGGMAVTENGVDIGMSEQFWQVSGDTLDTFRKSLLLEAAGVGSPTCIDSVGNSIQWIDTSKQIWSSSLGEIGEPIRSDLTGIVPSSSYIGYYKSGTYNWIYVLDAIAGKLFTYDLDLDQWNTPWTVAATAIASGETSAGVLSLMVAIGTDVYRFTPNTYNDAGATYEDDWKMGLIPISPGRNTTARSKIEPTQIEEIMFEMTATDFEGVFPAFVGQLCDDNPITADFYDWYNLIANNTTPQFIPRGRKLCQYRFISDSVTPPAIRAAMWVQWAPAQVPWRLLTFSISWIKA